MLFGIGKKNSTRQVDYTNTLREQGIERHEALIQANHVRLRPILMTTIAIVAGMIPIALGRGAGAGSRASMAVTILGGQALCLLLTLLVTPVVYSYFHDLRERNPLRRRAREAAGDAGSRGETDVGTPKAVKRKTNQPGQGKKRKSRTKPRNPGGARRPREGRFSRLARGP